MSIQDIQDRRKLQSLNLSREQIAKRAQEIMSLSQKDRQYMGTMEAVGRLICLAKCCDGYWSEKVSHGKNKEFDCLLDIAEGKKPEYFGYGGIITEEAKND